MQNKSRLSEFFTPRHCAFAFLTIHFGLIIIPGWIDIFSPIFLLWFIAFLIISASLIVTGIWGGIGLLLTKAKKTPSNPQHKFFVLLTGFSVLWLFVSMQIAGVTNFAYNHQKFDSISWRDFRSQHGNLSNLSLRQRMLDDLTTNVLPGRTKSELEDLLGKPDDRLTVDGAQAFLYIIGPEKGLGVDYECLLVIFDSEGRFKQNDTWPICG